MADYNCIIKLPNGGIVKVFFQESLTIKQLKQTIAQSIPGSNEDSLVISLSPNTADQTKIVKAINWTKYLTIDCVKKAYPLGFVNASSIEFPDGTDSFIMKLYVTSK
ncbi:hypothetical protein ACTFIY_009020 [Dictyostelium cf. discoideum]